MMKPNGKAGESNMNTPSGKSEMTTGKKKQFSSRLKAPMASSLKMPSPS